MGWLCLEGVLHLLAGILQAGLSLIRPAFGPGVVSPGGPADGLFGPAAQVLDLVLQFVFGAHVLPLPPRGDAVFVLATPQHATLKPRTGDPAAPKRGLQDFN